MDFIADGLIDVRRDTLKTLLSFMVSYV